LAQFRYFFSLPVELPGFDASEPEPAEEDAPLSPELLLAESLLFFPSLEADPDPLRA
jgi:hypothetical protein